MAAPPVTTLFPLAQLPACAQSCGPLYDANGACVPPNAPSIQTDCFCRQNPVSHFSTQTNGVCDGVCGGPDLASIQTWFQGFCGVNGGDVVITQTVSGTDSSATTGPTSGASRSSGGGGDWLSNHWKWVIMLVILVVGIAGIWIGACIWRRRYLKKKDRMYELGKHSGSSAAANTAWGPGGNASNIPYGGGVGAPASRSGKNSSVVSGPGMFMPATAPAVYDEKVRKPEKVKEKKKWVVKERT